MKILVIGQQSKKIKEVAKGFSLHKFDFVEVISEDSLLINGHNMDDYHGVLLTETNQVSQYIWSQNLSVPWFPSNPFAAKTANNHLFSFSIAEGCRFRMPSTRGVFRNGKVQVSRDFPTGKLLGYFVINPNEVIPIGHNTDLPKSLKRKSSKFLRALNVKFGVITFLFDRYGDFYFQNFTCVPDWESIPENIINSCLEYIIFSSKAQSLMN